MKSQYYFPVVLAFFYSSIQLCSCTKTKNELPPTIAICDTCKHQPILPVSVVVSDSNWSAVSPGHYSSNLYKELRRMNDTLTNILYIEIISGDYDLQMSSGQSISFYQGRLAFSDGTLSFNAFYNQLPFRSLDIRITAY